MEALEQFGPMLIITVAAVGFIVLFLYLIPVRLWIAAASSQVPVGILTLIGMRLRRVPPVQIIEPMINAWKAGLHYTANQLESHYLAGGQVQKVINALISAQKANIPLDFDRAAAIDLAGRDVFEAVQMSVNPKVITTPRVAAVAKDGIQVIAISRVTVRANIDKLVGGAGEETILARVGEGIVTTIGSAQGYAHVLENPDGISRTVLQKGLDAGTAFEILSIDIADVDVGENVGAKLQTEQAEADKNIAQARAEGRRAMAIAEEQEMKARTQEMRARVTEAEAQVPEALAEALRSGNIGAFDYYNLRNIVADTSLREGLGGRGEEEPES
ncbi:MAG: flotillin-like protein FloA [Myxococcota bacterium]